MQDLQILTLNRTVFSAQVTLIFMLVVHGRGSDLHLDLHVLSYMQGGLYRLSVHREIIDSKKFSVSVQPCTLAYQDETLLIVGVDRQIAKYKINLIK